MINMSDMSHDEWGQIYENYDILEYSYMIVRCTPSERIYWTRNPLSHCLRMWRLLYWNCSQRYSPSSFINFGFVISSSAIVYCGYRPSFLTSAAQNDLIRSKPSTEPIFPGFSMAWIHMFVGYFLNIEST